MKTGLRRVKTQSEKYEESRNSIIKKNKITWKPLKYNYIKKLPESIQEEIAELFCLTLEKPGLAIPKLKILLFQYPQIPQLYNFLSTAYSLLGEYIKSMEYAEECCKVHPEYLFAKINYAEICLKYNQGDKVPEIFNYNLNLKRLYPGREVFHFTEFFYFTGVCGLYYCASGQRKLAEECYRVLNILSPSNSYTLRLRSALLESGILEN